MTGQNGTTVVIPTYQEALNLPFLLPRIGRAMRGLATPFEIVVVDDASPDGTAEVAEAIGCEERLPLRVIRRERKESLASAVLCGVRVANYDCIAVMDADLSHDPAALPKLMAPVLVGEAEVGIGSRWVEGAVIGSRNVPRRFLTLLGSWWGRVLTGTRDPLSGFFACHRSLLEGAFRLADPRGFKILLDLLVRTRPRAVREVAIRFSDRQFGESKLKIRQLMEFFLQVIILSLVSIRDFFFKRIVSYGGGYA